MVMSARKGAAVPLPHESRLYSDLSHVYDKVFTRVFCNRIAHVVRSLPIEAGDRILEIGVGTGSSLSAYPRQCSVVGIDIAPEMLERARKKIAEEGWDHVRLQRMSALNLEFPANAFDYVTAFHVVSVVPDPARMLHEMQRVCKPGGTVVVINHFRAPGRALGGLAAMLDPLTRRLGWSSRLRLSDAFNGVPLRIEKKYKTSPLSLFTVVVARKEA